MESHGLRFDMKKEFLPRRLRLSSRCDGLDYAKKWAHKRRFSHVASVYFSGLGVHHAVGAEREEGVIPKIALLLSSCC